MVNKRKNSEKKAREILKNKQILEEISKTTGIKEKIIIKSLRAYLKRNKYEKIIIIFFRQIARPLLFLASIMFFTFFVGHFKHNFLSFLAVIIIMFFILKIIIDWFLKFLDKKIKKVERIGINKKARFILKTASMHYDPKGAVSIANESKNSGGELSLNGDKGGGLSKDK